MTSFRLYLYQVVRRIHRTVNGCRMYLLFIIQFVGELWAKANRAAAPRRTKRADRQFRRSTQVLHKGAALSCVGWVNQVRAKRQGSVLSAIGSLAVALLTGMRLAIFRRLGQCSTGLRNSGCCNTGRREIRRCESTNWLRRQLFGAALVPCPAPHLRAAPRAVIRSSRSPATNPSPLGWTDWA